MKTNFSLIITTIILCSCSSSVNVLKPQGEAASLQFSDDVKYEAELLAVDDTTLFFKHYKSLYKVPLNKAHKIFVQGYSLKSSKTVIIVPHILFGLLLANAAFDENQKQWGVFFSALIPLQILSAIKGDPQVSFSPELDDGALKKLKLYCRYPQGLTQEQWNALLADHRQDEFLPVP